MNKLETVECGFVCSLQWNQTDLNLVFFFLKVEEAGAGIVLVFIQTHGLIKYGNVGHFFESDLKQLSQPFWWFSEVQVEV